MKGLKLIKSNDGFTMVEMMIVGAILSVLMLAFTSYMFQQAKQNKVQEAKQSYTQLKSNVLNVSSQSDSLGSSATVTFSNLP